MKTPGLAILSFACALVLAQPAFATTRYVSPTGSGNACSDVAPCDLPFAAVLGGVGDIVSLASGTYDLGPTGITLPPGVSLVGAPGPRPTITGSPLAAATVAVTNATVKHLAIAQTNSGGAGYFAITSGGTSTLEDLILTSTGSGASLSVNDVLRDSVVRLTGVGGSGIQGTSIGGTQMDVRNVLVDAPGTATSGITAAGSCFLMPLPGLPGGGLTCMPPVWQPTINVRNSIIRSGGRDLQTTAMGTASGTINVAYSDYRAASTSADQIGTIVDQGGNIGSDPLFADAAAGDFRQVIGSPTIDAGDPLAGSDPKVGAFDLLGATRILGSRIDIGPHEFVPAQQPPTDNSNGDGSQGEGTDTGTPPVNPSPPSPPAADKRAPVLRSLRIAPGVLRKTAAVSYLASESGTATLTVVRKTTGVKKGRTCAKAGRKPKKGAKRCTRWVAVRGSLSHPAVAGRNSFLFDGKLAGRRLAAGSYRLVAIARDAAGNSGKPVIAPFRVPAR